jgi:hypothetical protein
VWTHTRRSSGRRQRCATECRISKRTKAETRAIYVSTTDRAQESMATKRPATTPTSRAAWGLCAWESGEATGKVGAGRRRNQSHVTRTNELNASIFGVLGRAARAYRNVRREHHHQFEERISRWSMVDDDVDDVARVSRRTLASAAAFASAAA